MSTFTVPITVAATEAGPAERVEAWVDTGSLYSWMPSELLTKLGIKPHATREFTLANGKTETREVGRAWITVEDQTEVTVVVFGAENSQALLGAYALEGLALAADPVNERVVPVARINAF